ncbi:MAG: helix-turn-helix domain-containing protein [Acidimicrobiales bacterium]
MQARGLLLAADGVANEEIARQCETTPDTVRRWRARFGEAGLDGIGAIAPGRGRKPEIPAETVEAIVRDTLLPEPDDGSTCWSTRSLGEVHGVGKDTVARIWKARNPRPWLVDTCKLSNDRSGRAFFGLKVAIDGDQHQVDRSLVEQLRAMLGSSVSDNTQARADAGVELSLTQPSAPAGPS